jgi:hypothetical protein
MAALAGRTELQERGGEQGGQEEEENDDKWGPMRQ